MRAAHFSLNNSILRQRRVSRRGPRRSNLSVAEGRPGPAGLGGGMDLGEPPGRDGGARARSQLLVIGDIDLRSQHGAEPYTA